MLARGGGGMPRSRAMMMCDATASSRIPGTAQHDGPETEAMRFVHTPHLRLQLRDCS